MISLPNATVMSEKKSGKNQILKILRVPGFQVGFITTFTIYVIDIEDKLEFLHRCPVGQSPQSVQQEIDLNVSTLLFIKQIEESLGEE